MDRHIRLQERKGYEAYASGGAMFYGIEWLQVSYNVKGFADIPRARRIAIELLDEFVSLGKADQRIQPYIKEGEFTQANVQIGISFCDNNGKDMLPPSVAHVFVSNGKISYGEIDNETGRLKIFDHLLVETVEEARQRLAEGEGGAAAPCQPAEGQPALSASGS